MVGSQIHVTADDNETINVDSLRESLTLALLLVHPTAMAHGSSNQYMNVEMNTKSKKEHLDEKK